MHTAVDFLRSNFHLENEFLIMYVHNCTSKKAKSDLMFGKQ